MIMKKTFKKVISLILCMLVAFSSFSSVAAAGYTTDYPQGVTAEEALAAVKGKDNKDNDRCVQEKEYKAHEKL